MKYEKYASLDRVGRVSLNGSLYLNILKGLSQKPPKHHSRESHVWQTGIPKLRFIHLYWGIPGQVRPVGWQE